MNPEHPTEDQEPISLGELQLPFDDDGMRRTVRRAIGRTAVDAAALTVIILVVGVMASLFVVQPLLINRSDRAAVAARAAYEAPMLFNPGAALSRFTIASGPAGRTSTVLIDIPLGSGTIAYEMVSDIGVFSSDTEWRVPDQRLVPIDDVLSGLDGGTVITIAFDLERPATLAAAQELADDPGRDVRLTWAGFDVESSVFGRVGYPICHTLETPDEEFFAATSASAGGTVTSGPPSIESALASARDALAVMASNDEVATAVAGGSAGAVESLSAAMDGERSVLSFVVTGPSPEVAGFLDDLGVSGGQVLAVGFYSWGSPVCGR